MKQGKVSNEKGNKDWHQCSKKGHPMWKCLHIDHACYSRKHIGHLASVCCSHSHFVNNVRCNSCGEYKEKEAIFVKTVYAIRNVNGVSFGDIIMIPIKINLFPLETMNDCVAKVSLINESTW